DHDWAVNWGSDAFPTGTATRDGPNIPVTGGEYNILFNSFTGSYLFVELRVFASMGLVGSATPDMSWDIDDQMVQSPENENVWTIQSIDLFDGEAKFRAEGNWTTNWGAATFPTGTGTQDGPNIPVIGGTYGITFNSETGEFVFGDPLTSTQDILDPSSIKAYPNPAQDVLYLDLDAIDITGEVSLQVYDMDGKSLLSDKQLVSENMKLNVAGLSNGYYTLMISNDRYVIGKKFVILR
nr:T9SS type A sorting domain-containing protein [Bacteroidota bacterium]